MFVESISINAFKKKKKDELSWIIISVYFKYSVWKIYFFRYKKIWILMKTISIRMHLIIIFLRCFLIFDAQNFV